MKRVFSIVVITLSFSFFVNAQQSKPQRVVAECTVDYSVTLSSDNDESLKATSKTVYIKGLHSRVDWKSDAFTQSVIYEKTSGSAVILREIGNNKLMTKLNSDGWKSQNAKYEGATLAYDTIKKTILGYECKKAILTLKDGTVINIFYASNIVPSVKEFEYQFKDIPGFVLEYDSQEAEGKKVKYTAIKINLNPVLASKFDIPTSGYRVIN